MQKTFNYLRAGRIIIIFNLVNLFWGVNSLLAQCSTTTPPAYSVSCLNQYYTAISASGTGVVSTIGVTGSSCSGTYYDYFSSQGITVPMGNTVDINVSRFTTTYIGYLSVYVDWNNNGTYDVTELAGSMVTMPASTLSTVYSFPVPTTGFISGTNLHMRVMLSEVSSGAPCTANYGEACDFYINVTCVGPASITGPAAVCEGAAITLSNPDAGGTWSTGNTSTATADPATGVVYGVAAGTTNVSYILPTGCAATAAVTVNIAPSPITGITSVCNGLTTSLANPVAGGTWSSSNTGVATVSIIGVVSGVVAGTANVSYTIGSCAAVTTVTVNTIAPITGPSSVCVGTTIALSDATPGGVWSSGAPTAATISPSGVVSGAASGSSAINYTVGTCTVTLLVTVGVAVAAITGPAVVCSGSTINLTDITPGGVWNSANTAVVTVSGFGSVAGTAQGVTDISYTIGGCSANVTITVNPSNAGTISGKDSICIGVAHQVTLSDNITGGAWSSTNTSRATVDPVTGIVTGVASGIDTIKYTISNSCGTFTVKKVIYVRTASKCATGIDEYIPSEQATLKIFPNPNTGIFTMNALSDIDEEISVVVTNVTGEKVKEFLTVTNKMVEVRLNTAPGIYLLQVSSNHARYIVKVAVN